MPKKKLKEHENVELENLTLEETEQEIEKTEKTIADKNKWRLQTKDAKKEAMGAYNDQLKEIDEDLEHYSGLRDRLKDHQKRLLTAPAFAKKTS